MSAAEMTAAQRELARHALGLTGRNRVSYRNHYVVDAGCPDHDAWTAMIEAGLAKKGRASPLTGGMDVFRLTRAGAEAALRPGERLCAEDFPPERDP